MFVREGAGVVQGLFREAAAEQVFQVEVHRRVLPQDHIVVEQLGGLVVGRGLRGGERRGLVCPAPQRVQHTRNLSEVIFQDVVDLFEHAFVLRLQLRRLAALLAELLHGLVLRSALPRALEHGCEVSGASKRGRATRSEQNGSAASATAEKAQPCRHRFYVGQRYSVAYTNG